MQLKRKFYLIGAALVLVVAILAGATVVMESRLIEANTQEYSAIQVLERLNRLENGVAEMRQAEVLIVAYAAVANTDSVQSLAEAINQYKGNFLGDLKKIAIPKDEKQNLSNLIERYAASIAVTIDHSNNYATDQAAENTTTASADLHMKLSVSLQKIGEALSKRSYRIKESAESIAAGANLGLFIILTGMVITFALAGFVVKRSVLTRIEKAVASARELAGGNLAARISIDTADEIGQLGVAFNEMADKVAHSIDELESEKTGIEQKVEAAVARAEQEKKYLAKHTNKMLAAMRTFAAGDLSVRVQKEKDDEIGQLFDGFNSTIENLNAMLGRVKNTIVSVSRFSAEILGLVNDHANRMQRQSSETVEIASAIQELSMTSNENTTSTDRAVTLATEAGEAARNGGTVINNSISAMNEIASVVDGSSENIRTLGTSSVQIGEIVKVIDEIADQTNLLALNAAIEAARAGEQGRGFAVVADEVRKLAERTTQATKEIESMIAKIQTDSGTAIEAMSDINAKVKAGKDLVDEAGNSLGSIIASTENTINVINQVATSSREQATTSDQVSQNIDSINQATEDSINSNEAIKTATLELTKLTESIEHIIGQFKLAEHNAVESDHLPVEGNGNEADLPVQFVS